MAHRFTCGEKKICLNIKMSQNVMKMIVCILAGAYSAQVLDICLLQVSELWITASNCNLPKFLCSSAQTA